MSTKVEMLSASRCTSLSVVTRLSESAEEVAIVAASTTVKTHVASILTRLGVRDRVQAVVVAHRSGLADRD